MKYLIHYKTLIFPVLPMSFSSPLGCQLCHINNWLKKGMLTFYLGQIVSRLTCIKGSVMIQHILRSSLKIQYKGLACDLHHQDLIIKSKWIFGFI